MNSFVVGSDDLGRSLIQNMKDAGGLYLRSENVPWFPDGYRPPLQCYDGTVMTHMCVHDRVVEFPGGLVCDVRVHDRSRLQRVETEYRFESRWIGQALVFHEKAGEPDPGEFRPASVMEIASLFGQNRWICSLQTHDPKVGVCQVYYQPEMFGVVIDRCVMNPLHHRVYVSRRFSPSDPYISLRCAG